MGDIKDVARDNYNALVVEPLNVDAFVDACIRLLSDKDLYQKLAKNAGNIAQEKKQEYSRKDIADVWVKALEIQEV